MQFNDFGNAFFEFVGAYMTYKNASKLYADKDVKGVYWPVTAFWALWGLWNLYYYPSLDQWLSFAGGALLVLGNIAWVVMAIKYLYFGDKHE